MANKNGVTSFHYKPWHDLSATMTTSMMRNVCFRRRAGRQWGSGLYVAFFVISIASHAMGQMNQIIYDDALENGWQNWGYATLNYANTSPVHSGSDSIAVTI